MKSRSSIRNTTLLWVTLLSVSMMASSLVAQTTKIMPLGNSITRGEESTGIVGYRKPLADSLNAAGVNFDFVGSLSDGSGFDADHEGWSGKKADFILANVDNFLDTENPDMVLLHIGTNDVSGSEPSDQIRADISGISDAIHAHNSNIDIILASLVPRDDAKDDITTDLNTKLFGLYLEKRDLGYKIYYAGMNEVFKCNPNWANNYLSDNVHPNDAGYGVMAGVWFNLIMNALNNTDITVTDNFERQNLGIAWESDPENVISNGDLINNSTTEEWQFLSIFKGMTNPRKLLMKWSNSSDALGVELSGLALMLDQCNSANASGYAVTARASRDEIRLWIINQGVLIDLVDAEEYSPLSDPGPGDVMRVEVSTDGSGNKFEVFINDTPYGTLVDPNFLQGKANVLYSGIIFLGNQENNIEDFTAEGGGDFDPPSRVEDLTLSEATETTVKVSWSAPGGDGSEGTASAYDLRYATTDILNEADFNAATPVENVPTPSPSGTPESMLVLCLQPGTTFYFALRSEDDSGNMSQISNVPMITTAPGELVSDDFNRASLGTAWAADQSMAIENDELANTSTAADDWNLAVFKDEFNPVEVSFKWAESADAAGIDLGGIAVMLDSPDTLANGYLITRRTAKNEYRLWEITEGGKPENPLIVTPGLPAPGPGDRFRIQIASDGTGNHFTIFVNGVEDVTLTDSPPTHIDPTSLGALYSGVMLAGDRNNNIDDFKLLLSPLSLQIVSGNNQTGTVGKSLPELLKVRLTSGSGEPLANETVSFNVKAGDGRLTDPAGNIVLEAESASLSGGMEIGTDGLASQGEYIHVPDGQGTENGLGVMTFNVPQTGTYYMWGRAIYPDGNSDAFKIKVDGGTEYVWDVDLDNTSIDWKWDDVSHRGSGNRRNPEIDRIVLNLTAGVSHTLEIIEGKDGTLLDQILFTTDPDFVPTGIVFVGDQLTQKTDANGEASANWILGPTAGVNNNIVSVSFLGTVSVDFVASATADVPATITKLSGDNQQADPGTQLPFDLLVQLKDQFGNLVSNYETNWNVITGNGTLATPNPVLSDATGQALNSLTTSTDTSLTEVQVTAPGSTAPPTIFKATATAGPADVMQKYAQDSGDNQTGTAVKPLSKPFKVLVTDVVSVPVANHAVTFQVTGGGGSFNGNSQTIVDTDVNGIASATLTLGPTPGATNTVQATSTFEGSSDPLNGSPITFTATAAEPKTLEALSSLSQNGTVSQPLSNPIRVRVKDELGALLSGHNVMFSVTQGGGKVNGSTNPVTVQTNSSGIAEVQWTLGPTAGQSNNKLVASATFSGQQLDGSPIEFSASAEVGDACKLVEVSGDSASGLILTPLSEPFVVLVEDCAGNPLAGWQVTFTVEAGGGNFDGSSSIDVTTDQNGLARATLTLGVNAATSDDPFNNRVRVTSENDGPLDGSPIIFVASAIATDARNLDLVGGGGQTGQAGETLPQQIRAEVTDNIGINPIANHPVRFQVTAGGGTLGNTASTDTVVNSDQNGVAALSWTLGGALGNNSQRLSISANDGVNQLDGSPITVFASATTGPVNPEASSVTSNVSEVPADGQSMATITVTLTDRFGNPISGKAVTINSTGSNNFISQPQTPTDGNGQATGTIASKKAEVKTVSARSVLDNLDLESSVNVEFQALDPHTLSKSSGDGQTANVGTALENPIEVLVADVNNNPVPGVTVDFEANGNQGFIVNGGSSSQSGAGKVSVVSVTDANGKARATWVLGPSPGTNTANASASFNGNALNGSPVTFSATGVIATAATIEEFSGNNQTGAAGMELSEPFSVLVRDENGKPVAGETINFSVVSGGGSLTNENPVSDYLGIAQATLTLGTTAGTNIVEVNHPDIGGEIRFTAEGVVGAPANLSAHAGDGGSGVVNSNYTISVIITDGHGNAFEGAHAAFEVIEGGAVIESQENTTNAVGISEARLRLPTTVGTVKVKATSNDLPGFFEVFTVTVLSSNATNISLYDGSGQDATVGRELVFPLRVLITDSFGNPVAGQQVTWVTQNGNSVNPEDSRSNEDGIASTSFTIVNSGTNQAAALAFSLNGSPVNFTATGVSNNFPLFADLNDTTVTEGNNLTIELTATDEDGDDITYEAENLPSGASFNDNVFSWTPSDRQAGEYEVTFFARDDRGGLDAETVTITVRNNNNPPVINTFSPAQVDFDVLRGERVNFSVGVSDADNDPLDISWLIFTDLNGSGTLVSTNLTYEFITDNLEASSYIIKVEVSDGQDMVSLSWKIDLIVTSVELASFDAKFNGIDGVKISWVTSREIDNLGFNILRSQSRNGDFVEINEELIDSNPEGRYEFVDRTVKAGFRYFYILEDVDINGRKVQHGPITVDIEVPENFELSQNFPNPFNPETKIRFQIPNADKVVIKILDMLGREVKSLVDERKKAGFHVVTWDATDNHGRKVSSGVYYYQIVSGEFRQTRKMLLLK
ncbi:T9SS type A sorting domain-containing protein [candidate division KSB1 bacterium]|nr:T9SS type A sorting domain-containing protein [candidate division KSB1 bacterium]NIR68374.1 T9SS type A sorting domain-containing protein [candidate division KSB1 bacterium]NIS25318.1 T9SS type A sorting domain-containing protein [candidate division KSB1 bacterium]NIT72229.1 T9SS type A sorting domain-containing protein [candidate division KSB1 bacterium]NIU26037.1 T9SS type A sorting domain-containing protein [candidate division KSB1 bacterium]